jgi:RNA polymerase sigma-70 factor (ECF subfamily)
VQEETAAESLERLRAGDASAFEALVVAYQHRVFSVAYRMLGSRAEAEDIAQEVFLRVHRGIAEFRGDAKLSTWLYAITSRLCFKRLASGERRMLRSRESEDTLSSLPSPERDAADRLERRETEAVLHQAIAELAEDRRIVVILRDLEGLAYEEIAETLGVSLGTVRSRLHRARLDLKERLEKLLA